MDAARVATNAEGRANRYAGAELVRPAKLALADSAVRAESMVQAERRAAVARVQAQPPPSTLPPRPPQSTENGTQPKPDENAACGESP
jgi:hypothetical protein